MAETAISSGEELLDGILTGQVPRQVRLFAAQGLLPVSREDLFRLQSVLSADPDEELAEMAAASLRETDPEKIVGWIKDTDVSPIELDLVSRVIRDESVWAAIVSHKKVSDETLCVLAQHATPVVQDIIITNQVRLLGCLEILDALRLNTQSTQVILRRAREFEEEFIEKAVAAEGEFEELENLENVSIEEPLEDLRAIGGQVPAEDEMPYLNMDDPSIAEVVEKLGVSAFGKLLSMDVKEKIMVAIKGTREERGILINSRNRLVLRGVLASPKLTDSEIEKFASSRSVSDEVVRIISNNPRWMRIYPVVVAITQNPKTPIMAAIRLLPKLAARDLVKLSRDRNVSSVLRRRAHEQYQRARR